jgi:hypothetical protein
MARIVLVVQSAPRDRISLTWFDGPSAFEAYELRSKTVTAAADRARRALGEVVEGFSSKEAVEVSRASEF